MIGSMVGVLVDTSTRPAEWSEPEQRLWEAYRRGEWLDLSEEDDDPEQGDQWDAHRTIRDVVIEQLLLHGPEPYPGYTPRLRLHGARITGHLDLSDSRITTSITLTSCSFEQPVNLSGAELNTLNLAGSHLPGIEATQAYIARNLMLRHVTTTGELRLLGVRIGGQLALSNARLTHPGQTVLLLDRATIEGGLFLQDVVTAGEVRLLGAHIGGHLDLSGARLTNPGRTALNLDGAAVGGNLLATNLLTTGETRLPGVRVSGDLALTGAWLTNQDGTALNLDRAAVEGNLFANDGFTATGEVRLFSARIGGQLALNGAQLTNPGGNALHLAEAQATRLVLVLRPNSTGLVNLRDARVGRFTDDPRLWPPGCQVDLDGFSYERLSRLPSDTSEPCPIEDRLAWMQRFATTTQLPGTAEKSRAEFSPTPYEQLAAALHRDGQERQARLVSRERERLHHRSRGVLSTVWGAIQRWTIGYGYQPVLALAWVLGVLTAGTLYFATAGPLTPIKDDEHPTWDPFLYTLDLLVPVLDLGHEKAWDPVGADRWAALLLMAAGWVLVTSFVAGASRVLRRP